MRPMMKGRHRGRNIVKCAASHSSEIRDALLAGVRLEEREVYGQVMQVKVYPDSRGSDTPVKEGGGWGALREVGSTS